MKTSLVAALGAVLVSTVGVSSAAQATVIDFAVGVSGGTLSALPTPLQSSTFLDLDGSTLAVTGLGVGDGSGLAIGDPVTIGPTSVIDYGSGAGPLMADVVKSWTDALGTFTETLDTVVSIDRTAKNAITVTLSGSLLDPMGVTSPAFLILSATEAGGPGNVISASLTNTSSIGGVPETSTWVMMALGFGALGYAASRRRKTNIAMLSA
jgi:hypothetical protein